MTRKAKIERTINAIKRLHEEKAEEISYFVDFMIKRYDEQLLSESIQQLTSKSQTFQFLESKEDLYTPSDLKEVYNG
jgi:uncharacterized membrane-anchored protein YjiN (DUF445 family)